MEKHRVTRSLGTVVQIDPERRGFGGAGRLPPSTALSSCRPGSLVVPGWFREWTQDGVARRSLSRTRTRRDAGGWQSLPSRGPAVTPLAPRRSLRTAAVCPLSAFSGAMGPVWGRGWRGDVGSCVPLLTHLLSSQSSLRPGDGSEMSPSLTAFVWFLSTNSTFPSRLVC